MSSEPRVNVAGDAMGIMGQTDAILAVVLIRSVKSRKRYFILLVVGHRHLRVIGIRDILIAGQSKEGGFN